ncbi:MAG: hypothetical protein SynsKO_39070 [Synoicihabitans sp.]
MKADEIRNASTEVGNETDSSLVPDEPLKVERYGPRLFQANAQTRPAFSSLWYFHAPFPYSS